MSNRGNPYKVGLFILVTVTLLAATLVTLGALKYFRTTLTFMTIVPGTVQGLEKGAKVKLSGVTIGRVVQIQIGDLRKEENEVFVTMEFDADAMRFHSPRPLMTAGMKKSDIAELFKERVEEVVKNGMRCQLQYGDITGTVYVELSFVNPAEYPLVERNDLPEDHPVYVPSIPSASIGNVIVDFQKAIVKISRVDFAGLSSQLERFLETANKVCGDSKTREFIEEARKVSDNLRVITDAVKDSWSKKKLEDFYTNFSEALAHIDTTMDDISKFTKETGDEIKKARLDETTQSSREVLGKSQEALGKLDGLQEELRQAVAKLDETLRAARNLMDYLEKQPDALLGGKPDARVVEPK